MVTEKDGSPHAFCPRCNAERRIIRPWRGWRPLRIGWFVVLGILLLLSPVLSADYIVMTPVALAIVAAIGPLNHLASQKPICRTCGLGLAR